MHLIVIYLCIHGKCNPWDYVTMARDVRLFKVWRTCFLHHKFIGFTLARHKLSAHALTHSLRYWLLLRIINNYISINCFFFLTFSSNTPSHNIRKMALLSKSVIEEPEYHGKGHESTIIYYMLIIPVILHRSVGGSKVSLSEKIPQ